MRSRLTSSRFIGRVGELAELQLAVREASGGRAALVLLGGDSGVGKTRLVGELESRCFDDAPVLVLRGEGVQQADAEMPYAPLLGALRPLVRSRDPALDALSPGSRAELATILPALATNPTGLATPAAPRDDRTADRGGQLRLFEAVLELVDQLCASTTVLLILEDLHWADRSTRAFAAFLARNMRYERLCVVLTYRTDELHRRHPLRPLLSELQRLERARRIELEPFDRAELSEALSDILGAAPDAQLLERLLRRGEGNPLYTEELLAAGLDGRGAAPQSLRDAFVARVERLSDDGRRVARAVAVGGEVDEPALAAVTAIEHDRLQAALRETVAEQVLVAADDGRLRFRHALLREALYDDLLPGERGDLHIALARHLEQAGAAGDDGEPERTAAVAGHYTAAGDQAAALRATVQAALAAARTLAFGEAADLTERALELWPRVAGAEALTGLDHVELLARAARAHQILDQRGRSEVLLQRALGELDPEREPARCAALLEQLSRTLWKLNRGEDAMAAIERALAMLPEPDPDGARPLMLAWLARIGILRGRFRRAVQDGERALGAATAAGDRCAETEVLNTLGMARAALQEVDAGVELLRRAIALAGETGDSDSLATAYSNLADVLILAGRTRAALETAREGLAQAPRWHVRTWQWLELMVSEAAFEAGEWEVAREHLAVSPSRLEGILLIFRQLREADLALGTGDEETAQRCLASVEELVAASSEPQWIGLYGALSGELAARRRDLDGGRAAVARALDRLELCTDDVMRIARVSVVGVALEADRAQRARDLRLAGERRDALARARLHVSRLQAAAAEGGAVERARLAHGRAELARARGRAAQREWARTAAAWDEIDRPYPAAVARWREAEALLAADRRPQAAVAASAALAGARALGSGWLAREVTGLAERARLDLGSAGAAGDGRGERAAGGEPEPSADPFGLTPRERQVLGLLAQGATNRQIGAALFMAEKTASVHVSRILAKLGVRTRTEAAAVAYRQHLD
jgi:DNA-binding CsgD family transcriptional regulator/tetratricopeptide (TPR) repeat protein